MSSTAPTYTIADVVRTDPAAAEDALVAALERDGLTATRGALRPVAGGYRIAVVVTGWTAPRNLRHTADRALAGFTGTIRRHRPVR